MIIEKRKYGVFDIIRIPLKCAPVLGIVVGLEILLAGIVPTVQVVVTANFIDTAISIVKEKTKMGAIYPSLIAVVALIAYSWISNALAKFAQVRLEIAIRETFRTAITEKRAKLAYKHVENHDTWDLISRISKTPEQQIKNAYIDFMYMISICLRIVGILGLLITHVLWAALLIFIVSVPLLSLAIKSGKANYEVNREVTKYTRKYEYLAEILTGREAVDERTLFGYGKKLSDIWYDQYETARKITYKTSKKWFIKMKTGSIITAFVSVIIILVLLNPVLTGAISPGMFMSLVNAVFGLVQMMSWSFTYSMDQLAKNVEYLKDLTKFATLEETLGANDKPVVTPPEFRSLEFKNVRFKYPGTDNYILDGISFRIEANRHYAFVGINGAGKTTIIKLITGLYNDFEGDIYINDKSIREYSQSQLKALYSIVYQDFAKYYITLKDNIGVGNINRIYDENIQADIHNVIDRVGLSQLVKKLPKGIDTPLGKIKEGGVDVSGGEWQRIAMARALMKPAPLLILDEPTAALDPISESRLYEEFGQISRDKTTIFISHRLGSTKLADEILVIGDGRVLERGTHRQLMELGGVYAKMYESQRSWYE
ncbi:ATP-binding cassette, subfamily B [Caldanaerobius fijiensis DSM 17918]|uniref:ATP-binding cassette, subfamily B n=1 Tax=Caldanaerobius fijiensis DSM 17918 TaxID=1121256 RepID=A0A1M4YDF8_9THEO|nr:ABC transporter ATP-binding protein [Caldanaerobius fijiensis]SHF03864.1 ATP-binding cassette, subfamily B [Caldanaerobius fijiensis DSM 17918]